MTGTGPHAGPPPPAHRGEAAADQTDLLLGASAHLVDQVDRATAQLTGATAASLAAFDARVRAIAEELERAFEITTVDHAAAVGESSTTAVRQLQEVLAERAEVVRTALTTASEGLVDRLEVAAEVYRTTAEDLTAQLSGDVGGVQARIAEAFADSSDLIAETVSGAIERALETTRDDVAAIVVRLSHEQAKVVFRDVEAPIRSSVEALSGTLSASTSKAAAEAGDTVRAATREAADALVDRVTTVSRQLQQVVSTATSDVTGQSAEARRASEALTDVVANAVERLTFNVTSAVERLNAGADTVAAAMREGVSHADTAVARAEGIAEQSEDRLADAITRHIERLLTSTDAAGRSAGAAAEHMQSLAASTGEVDRRIASASTRIEQVLDAAHTSMQAVATDAAARLSRELAALLGGLRDAVTTVQDRTVGSADAARTQVVAALAEVSGSMADNAATMRSIMAIVDQVNREVQAGAVQTTAAAEGMEQVAERVARLTDESAVRLIKAADGMTDRLSTSAEDVARGISERTAGDVQALTTTVAWANRTIQQLVETTTDDLASASRAAAAQIEESAETGRDRMGQVVARAEGRLAEEVLRGLRPLTGETDRVAEQQATLAATIARAEALMAQREAEMSRREELAVRMEAAVADAAQLLTARASHLRQDEQDAVEAVQDVARRLEVGGRRAAEVIDELDRVTGRLHEATAAADTSRRALEDVVTRAAELAADAAARRRRAPAVPPPTTG